MSHLLDPGIAPVKKYRVLKDAWLYGKFFKAGEFVELNDKQAKYELMSGNIELYVPVLDLEDESDDE